MRFFGIDVGSLTHVLAMVNEALEVLLKPTSFGSALGCGARGRQSSSGGDLTPPPSQNRT